MIQFTNYTLIEKLVESGEAVVYRGVRKVDQRPIIVKVPRSDYPSPRMLASLQHEHSILRELDVRG